MAAVAGGLAIQGPMVTGMAKRATDAANTATNAAATDTVSAPAVAGYVNVLRMIHWSYSATPTDGALSVTDGTSTWTWKITAGGPGFMPFAPGWAFTGTLTITLAAGGSGIVGTVYATVDQEKSGGI